jgi:hypothetical protein
MIRDWSPEARLVLAFGVAPLAVPVLYSLPGLVMGARSGQWGFALVVLVVGALVTYVNALVVAAPLWIIVGRSRLVRNHWPLTIGGSLSGMATVILFANRWNMTSVLFGTAAGFATALLFWAIALREGPRLGPAEERQCSNF